MALISFYHSPSFFLSLSPPPLSPLSLSILFLFSDCIFLSVSHFYSWLCHNEMNLLISLSLSLSLFLSLPLSLPLFLSLSFLLSLFLHSLYLCFFLSIHFNPEKVIIVQLFVHGYQSILY